ncbi:MAG TPA: hypothetical protein VMH02_03770 [Verrucomicrobiae bacterium]|nr:hypothetical protein [Verrucomicrobiae bacterium]
MRRFGTALLLLLSCACSHQTQPAATPPPLLIDQRGTTMPLEKAILHVAFRPFIPSSQVLAYAVLPPLGDLDTDAHRGLGIEYVQSGEAMLLSQWPKQGYTIFFRGGSGSIGICKPAHYKADGVAWVTPHNVVVTLQPDGNVAPSTVDAEARRLIRAGACR